MGSGPASRRLPRPAVTRRQFLERTAVAGGLCLAADRSWSRILAQSCADAPPAGTMIGTLPLYGPGSVETPLGQMLGGPGLDARRFTDLSRLDHDRLLTPSDDLFVRTAAPPGLQPDAATWRIAVPASGDDPGTTVSAAELALSARAMGAHLIECAGNSNPRNFGLMSAVEWHGVPLARVLERLPRPASATAVLVAGVDHDAQQSLRSQPGASWVFPLASLDALGPFLATGVNGHALTPDHGAPVRLVVPGWYGCAWIKWVNEIRYVGADEPATSQMREFAGRTHQDAVHLLARDYDPPAIDTAAMPIRVEQWRGGAGTEYRIVGIVWGGVAPVDRLVIRFGSRDAGTPVRVCPAPVTHRTWALWSHRWRPAEPGYYDISLKAADPAVRTRRLDLSFYIRRVRIDDI